MTANVLVEHLVNQSITSSKIKDGVLEGAHVPLNSIPISNYNDTFSISRGGTGKTSFDNYGVFHVNSAGEYATNLDFLMIKNGLMGVGGTPDTGRLLTVRSAQNARLGISADDEKKPNLLIENSVASWHFYVDALGDYRIDKGSDLVLKMTSQGNVGFAHNEPTEILSLTGPLVLGPTVGAGEPGSIRYQDNQFSVYKTSWQPISSGSLSKRVYDSNQVDNVIASSVIFSNDSNLVGQNLMIQSADMSSVFGQYLNIGQLSRSEVFGQFSTIQSANSSQFNSSFSGGGFIKCYY